MSCLLIFVKIIIEQNNQFDESTFQDVLLFECSTSKTPVNFQVLSPFMYHEYLTNGLLKHQENNLAKFSHDLQDVVRSFFKRLMTILRINKENYVL